MSKSDMSEILKFSGLRHVKHILSILFHSSKNMLINLSINSLALAIHDL